MLGSIYKVDKFSRTFLVHGCANVKFCRVLNKKFKTLIPEVGKEVSFEISDSEPNRLPTLEKIEEAHIDHCPDCWDARPLQDTQPVCYCTLAVGRRFANGVYTVVNWREKFYEHGPGLKLTMKSSPDSTHTYHAVFFDDAPYYDVVSGLKDGDIIRIGADCKTSGEQHSLLTVFHIDKISNPVN